MSYNGFRKKVMIMNFENYKVDGKINFNDKECAFHFENNILTIFPNSVSEQWNSYRDLFFRNKESKLEQETYYGTALAGNSIAFINVELVKFGRSFYRGYVPAYIVGKENGYIPAPKATDFVSMQFRGKCIDQLYNPKNIIKKETISKRLVPNFTFYNSKEILKKIDVNNDKFNFNVMWNISSKELNTPIKLKSQIWIKFNEKKKVEDIINYYTSMSELMSFLYNRNIVEFDEIKLTSKIWVEKSEFDTWKNKKRKLVPVDYYLHVNHNKKKEIDLLDLNLSLSLDTITNHFSDLYEILSNEKETLFAYPNNNYEASHVDSYQFIKIASSFEGQFDKLYPNYKSTSNEVYKALKDNVLNYISCLKKDDNTKRKNKYIDNFYNAINNLDGSLEEQITKALKDFTKPLEKIKQRLFVTYNLKNVTNGDLAHCFSKKRNEITHLALSRKFMEKEIVAYLLVKILIHCIILKRSKFDEKDIIEIINRIYY